MENRYRSPIPFTSYMDRREFLMALFYLPVHVFGLPMILSAMVLKGTVTETEANFLCYAIGVGYILSVCMGFLRRDFDPLCDRPLYVIAHLLGHYGLMIIMNMAVNSILIALSAIDTNPNNSAVAAMVGADFNMVAAFAIFLAPVLEEVMFRGAVFGTLRGKSRLLAYSVSMLLFSLYHIWGYALYDWRQLIYIVQYLPVSYLLCRIYEKTNTIWAPIFLHMMVNAVSINLMNSIGGIV